MRNISMRLIRTRFGRVDARAGRRGGASRRRACAGRHHRARIARLNVRRRARDVVDSRDARAAMENNETRALLAIRAVGVSMSIDDASSCADRGGDVEDI